MKSPIILRIFKDDKLQEIKQFEKDQIIFGQDAEVQVELKDDKVSPIHCLIELRDSGYHICDLGSQTGTFKNDQQVLDDSISSGDQIKIGPYTIHFFVGVPKPAIPPIPSAPAQQEPAKPAAQEKVKAKESEEPKVVVPSVKPQVPAKPKSSSAKSQPKLSGGEKSGSSIEKTSLIKKDKKEKTFAAPSEIKDLKDYLKPTKGPIVQVILAWKERVLSTQDYPTPQKIRTSDIIPTGFVIGDHVLIDVQNSACVITAPVEATIEFVGQKRSAVGVVNLEQGEIACISFSQGTFQVYVRFVPETRKPIFAPFLDFSSSEVTGIIATMVIVALTALYMSLYTPPPPEEKKEDEQVRLAQFVFNKPKEPLPKVEAVETPPPKPPEVKKVIKVTDKPKETAVKSKQQAQPAKAEAPATKAAEVKPIPSKVNRPKKFTSTHQGGAVKIGEKEGASAKTAKDVSKTGLMAAFGGGGVRKELDRASSGAGDLIGMANEATGKSGQNENRAGDDIGSKFKDTGAGGKGTATAGISGIGTKGRSSGQSTYGGLGVGGKGNVAIEAGGADAEFVGSIDREAVRRVVRSKLNEIKNCYERALNTNKDLEGKIVIRFLIEEQGRVRIATTKSSTLNNKTVEACVAARIRNAIFPEPPPGTVAEVDYPFVFGAQN